MIGSDDVSLHSQLSSCMFDGSCFMNTSDSSYNSDLGSGNEDSHDTSFIIYGESSDEADFLSVWASEVFQLNVSVISIQNEVYNSVVIS